MRGCLSFPADPPAAMYAESCWTPRRCPCTMPGIASTKRRFERLNQALRELLDLVRERRT